MNTDTKDEQGETSGATSAMPLMLNNCTSTSLLRTKCISLYEEQLSETFIVLASGCRPQTETLLTRENAWSAAQRLLLYE
jgi:hypothetical protein